MSSPDDLASKANIIIDPAEIQAASMDDLDEDEESGAAQVEGLSAAAAWRWETVDGVVSWLLSLPAEAVCCGGGGRSSGQTQLAELSHSGPSQPLSEHGCCQPDDPQTTSHAAGESEDPNPGGGAENGERQ